MPIHHLNYTKNNNTFVFIANPRNSYLNSLYSFYSLRVISIRSPRESHERSTFFFFSCPPTLLVFTVGRFCFIFLCFFLLLWLSQSVQTNKSFWFFRVITKIIDEYRGGKHAHGREGEGFVWKKTPRAREWERCLFRDVGMLCEIVGSKAASGAHSNCLFSTEWNGRFDVSLLRTLYLQELGLLCQFERRLISYERGCLKQTARQAVSLLVSLQWGGL